MTTWIQLALAGLLLLPAAQGVPWYREYEAGLQLIDEGRPREAREALEQALEARPTPGLRLPTEGIRYADYLPNLYLAIACQMSGQLEDARSYLAAAEEAGAAADSVAGSHLLEAYQILLEVPPEETPGPVAEPAVEEAGSGARSRSFLDFEPAEKTLSEAELETLKRKVLERCGLASDLSPVKAPWYFHYELAQELERQGDPQRALDALIEATRRRPQPRRGARMYGMWFTDYLPYLSIARTHAALGNWDCVADALRVAEKLGEVREGDREYDEFETLRAEVASRKRQ